MDNTNLDLFKVGIVIIDGDFDTVRICVNEIKKSNKYKILNVYTHFQWDGRSIQGDDPDIVIMDFENEEEIRKIRRLLPESEILIIGHLIPTELILEAFYSGASGFLLKHQMNQNLIDALNNLVEGGAPISPFIAKKIVLSLRRNDKDLLSKRELDVLDLLVKGKSYKAISNDLKISPETTKSHLKNLYAKLNVSSRFEAIFKAARENLIRF